MCDPIGMIGLAFSIGSTMMQMQAQQDVQNKQQAANDEWLSYQRMKARQHDATQEQMRQKADTARMKTLNDLGADKQAEAQKEEQTRLEGELMPTRTTEQQPLQSTTNDNALLGEGAGSKVVQSYADAVTNASRTARERMQALATVNSTTGSQFGLANRANSLLGTSQDAIKLQSDLRQGDLITLGVAKAVEPIKYAIGSGAGAAGAIGQAAAGLAGKSLGAAAGQV